MFKNNCDKQSSFEELLVKDSSVSIHDRNIQILALEMYKVSQGMSHPQITELFTQRNEHPYDLRYNAKFLQPFVNSVRCELKTSHTQAQRFGKWFQILIKIQIVYITTKRLLKNGSLKTVHPEPVRFLSKIQGFVKLLELSCSLGQQFFIF